MTDTPVATLKLVAIAPGDSGVKQGAQRVLVEIAGESEVRAVGDRAFVVHTSLTTAELRDRLQPVLADADSAIVAEFETWSGYGPEVDSVWLMRRGH